MREYRFWLTRILAYFMQRHPAKKSKMLKKLGSLGVNTAWKVSKYGPEKTPCVDIFHTL